MQVIVSKLFSVVNGAIALSYIRLLNYYNQRWNYGTISLLKIIELVKVNWSNREVEIFSYNYTLT